jgi:hypothetical protein
VAKSADAKDLKSFFRQRECGFKSHPGHQNISFSTSISRPEESLSGRHSIMQSPAGDCSTRKTRCTSKPPVWLTDTGLTIHMEPTWVNVLQVEDAWGNAVNLPGDLQYITKGQTERKALARRIQ